MAFNTRVCSILIAMTAAFASGADVPSSSLPEADEAARIVSPALSPSERDYVLFQTRQVLKTLRSAPFAEDPAKVHVAIIDGRTGTLHYNHPEDAGSLESVERAAMPGEEVPTSGQVNAAGCYDPGVYQGSGPYRRVYTTCLNPIPAAQTQTNGYGTGAGVTINCSAGSFLHDMTHADVGFLYMGGWSSDPTKPGSAVDAGLQYNYEVRPTSGDNYTPIISVSGYKHYTGKKGYAATGNKIPCTNAHPIGLIFGVAPTTVSPGCDNTLPSCSTYALVLEISEPNANGKYRITQMILWVAPNEATGQGIDFGGWATLGSYVDSSNITHYYAETPCGGCIFKYMTSIGQVLQGDLHDGSTYGASWSSRHIDCWATTCDKNHDTVLVPASLLRCSEYPVWHGGVYQNGTRDCTKTPKSASGAELSVQVLSYGPDQENDQISLTH